MSGVREWIVRHQRPEKLLAIDASGVRHYECDVDIQRVVATNRVVAR